MEATQIDVAAKYAGRLEQVMVQKGDEVAASQMIARISSPDTKLSFAGHTQVPKAKQALAEAIAPTVGRSVFPTAALSLRQGAARPYARWPG